jgi:hypothetical protein
MNLSDSGFRILCHSLKKPYSRFNFDFIETSALTGENV